MSAYDNTSPAQAHQALNDIDKIRANTDALRDNESSAEASPPSNPVAGQWWHTSDTDKVYLRTNSGTWQYLFRVSDLPAKSSDLTAHTGANITSGQTVHGIRQGSGNGLDADTVDGYHASSFLQTSHGTATSGVHGAGSGVILSAPTTTPFLVIASTAPTGWTQNTTYNDRVIRIVSGVGGGVSGSWTISGLSHAHTHSTPNHGHNLAILGTNMLTSAPSGYAFKGGNDIQHSSSLEAGPQGPFPRLGYYTETTGAGTSGGASTSSVSSDGNWRPAYLDVIAVVKNA